MKKLKSNSKYSIIKSHRELEDAIKAKCFDGMGGQKKIDCELFDCSLYRFRPWVKDSKTKVLLDSQS